MKKLRESMKNPIIFSLVLNVFVLLLSLALFKPFLEENDDLFLSMISEGVYGLRDSHLIYSNIIFGKIIVSLVGILPGLRAFTFVQYVLMFSALFAFTYLIARRDKKYGRLLSVIFILSVFYECYVSFQYTKVAAILACIGFMLMFEKIALSLATDFHTNDGGAVNKKELLVFGIAGTVFVTFSYLIRDNGFFMGAIPAFIMGLYLFVSQMVKASDSKVRFRVFSKYFLTICPAFVLIIIAFLVNSYAYSNDENWKRFMEFNKVRTELIDDRADLLDTTVYFDELKAAGVSENDAFIYITWQFGDDSIFDMDLMQRVLLIRDSRLMGMAFYKALASRIFEELFSLYAVYIGFLCIGVFVLMQIAASYRMDKSKGQLAYNCSHFAISMIAIGIILFYFEYSERWSHRIVSSLFLIFIVTFVYFFMGLKEKSDQGMILAIVIMLVVNLGLLLGNRFDYNAYMRNEPSSDAAFDYFSQNKDTLFVLDTFTFQNNNKYDVFTAFSEGSLDNSVIIGSWFVNSPVTKGVTSSFGYTNPYDALVNGARLEGKKVVLVDNNYPDQKAEYLTEHYDGEYGFEEILDSDLEPLLFGYKCYRCVLK